MYKNHLLLRKKELEEIKFKKIQHGAALVLQSRWRSVLAGKLLSFLQFDRDRQNYCASLIAAAFRVFLRVFAFT